MGARAGDRLDRRWFFAALLGVVAICCLDDLPGRAGLAGLGNEGAGRATTKQTWCRMDGGAMTFRSISPRRGNIIPRGGLAA
jgi:hypothetical protein